MSRQRFEVSKNTVKRAAECQNNLNCLDDHTRRLCLVQYVSLGRFSCLRQHCDPDCNYCTSIDSQSFCGCPVRVEIYQKYQQ